MHGRRHPWGSGRQATTHARPGTKHLIESYIEEVAHALELLASEGSGDISQEEKLDFFRRASHCFGHSALMMSGSGSLLYFHAGVIRALGEADLLPTIMSGSSGGSLVGSIVATHTDDEVRESVFPPVTLEALDSHGDRLSEFTQTLRMRATEFSMVYLMPAVNCGAK